MNRRRVSLLLLVVSTFMASFGQSKELVPYNGQEGPTYSQVSVNFEYQGRFERIDKIDFGELALQTFGDDGTPSDKAELHKGKYEKDHHRCFDDVRLHTVQYSAALDATRRFGLVIYEWSEACGSSGQTGIASIFELADDRLFLRQQLSWDQHFDTNKPYFQFSEKSGVLVVRSAHYVGIDAHCCVSGVDVVKLQWDGNRFIKKVVWTELSASAERDGVTMQDLLNGNHRSH